MKNFSEAMNGRFASRRSLIKAGIAAGGASATGLGLLHIGGQAWAQDTP
ncbi:hypothetical protein BH09CHL1_BH09CHL1_25950 [soil metagenome]